MHLHKKFYQGTPSKQHDDRNNDTYIHLLYTIILASNAIVDTMTSRAQRILDGSPFTWPIAFGYDVKTSHMEIREGKVKKGARHLPI